MAPVALGLGAAWRYLTCPASTRQRVAPIAKSISTCMLGAVIACQEVQDEFTSAAPKTVAIDVTLPVQRTRVGDPPMFMPSQCRAIAS